MKSSMLKRQQGSSESTARKAACHFKSFFPRSFLLRLLNGREREKTREVVDMMMMISAVFVFSREKA